MTRRISAGRARILSLTALLGSGLLPVAPACTEEAKHPVDERPNVIVYVADTLRADALRRYGNAVVETPAIDSLAREAALYESAYASTSWTRASVASILTGLHPGVHGSVDRPDILSGRLALLSEIFDAHGYATASIVANPNASSHYGFNRGYDDYIELYKNKVTFHVGPDHPVVKSDELTRRAIDWLDGVDRPFFLFMLTVDPHWPYWPPPEFDRYGGDYRGRVDEDEVAILRSDLSAADKERVRSLYYGEISFNDRSLGELIEYLKKRGILDDTIVVFTSDHGEEFWEHGGTLHGTNLYEETVRVPLIVRYPRAMPVAARIPEPVELVDIFPTLLDLAGIESPYPVSGRSLRQKRGDTPRARHATLALDGVDIRSITVPPWKYIRDEGSRQDFLFNLEVDPNETWNRVPDYPERVEALSKRLDEALRADAARRDILHAGEAPRRISDHELSDDAREALEALGYIDTDE